MAAIIENRISEPSFNFDKGSTCWFCSIVLEESLNSLHCLLYPIYKFHDKICHCYVTIADKEGYSQVRDSSFLPISCYIVLLKVRWILLFNSYAWVISCRTGLWWYLNILTKWALGRSCFDVYKSFFTLCKLYYFINCIVSLECKDSLLYWLAIKSEIKLSIKKIKVSSRT